MKNVFAAAIILLIFLAVLAQFAPEKDKSESRNPPKTEIKKSRKQHPDIGKRFETKQVYPIYIDRTR